MSELPNIVLVHGAWADGSCWGDVIKALQSDSYQVTAPQFPETSLAATIEVASSHLAMVSNPHAVTKLIKEAADTIRSGSA
jgi:hypothetical protein